MRCRPALTEASAALGISPRQTFTWIRFPLAMRYALKAYQNEALMFTKGTAIVGVITVVDLTAAANEVFERTYDPVTPMLTAAALYWTLVNVMRIGFELLDRMLNRHLTADEQRQRNPNRGAASGAAGALGRIDCLAHGAGAMSGSAPHPAIVVSGLDKWYGQFQALKQIDLDVSAARRSSSAARPGSGKSTLIRCINRLEPHDGGRIVVNGIDVNDATSNIQDVRREVGMVFQSFNLFPHLTILENCVLAPRLALGMKKAEAKRVAHALSRARAYRRSGAEVSGAAFRRSAAARRDRPRTVHGAAHHAVR